MANLRPCSFFILLCLASSLQAQSVRTYFVGNSVTDTVKYGVLAELAKDHGHQMPWGRHMIPGAPLYGMIENARAGTGQGFREAPYGDCIQALTRYEWDALILQPFDRRHISDQDKTDNPQGDMKVAQQYIDLALAKNPHTQIYIYARWPRCYREGRGVNYDKESFDRNVRGVSKAPKNTQAKTHVDPYVKAWESKYTAGWGMQLESKSYFEFLVEELRKQNPNMKKAICIIPVGHVMAELDKRMRAGKVAGYRDIHGVYADGIHLDNVGSYICAATFYTCLFKENPQSLNAKRYGVTDKSLVSVINQCVWNIVRQHKMSGVGDQ